MAATAEATATQANNETNEETSPTLVDSKLLRAEIAKIGKQNQRLKEDRAALNANIQANLEKLVSRGISKESLKRAIKDCELHETQLDNQDLAYQICRAAMGKPIQMTLLPDTTKH